MAFKMSGWSAFTKKTDKNVKIGKTKPDTVSAGMLDEQSGSTASGDEPNPNKIRRRPEGKTGMLDPNSGYDGPMFNPKKRTRPDKPRRSPMTKNGDKKFTKTKVDKLYKKDGGVIDRPKRGMGYIADATGAGGAEGASEFLTQAQINKMKNGKGGAVDKNSFIPEKIETKEVQKKSGEVVDVPVTYPKGMITKNKKDK